MTGSVASSASRLAGALAPALLVFAGTPAMAAGATDETSPAVAQVSPPNKITSFDIGFVDPLLGRYFLADRTGNGITVVNTTTLAADGVTPAPSYDTTLCFNKFAGPAPPAKVAGPNGVIVVNHQTVWAGDGIKATGAKSTVKVCSLGGTLLKTIIIPGGTGRADEGCFDPVDQQVMFTNDAESPFPFTTIISAKTYKVLAQISFSPANMAGTVGATAGAEQCQYNSRTGTYWHALPECYAPAGSGHGCVVEISPISKTIIATYDVPVAGCTKPQGLVIGPAPQVFLGCNANGTMNPTYPTTILSDGTSGAVARGGVWNVVEEVGGSDEVAYNPTTNHYFMASSSFHSNGNPKGAYNCGTGPTPPALANTPGPQLLAQIDAGALTGAGADLVTAPVDYPAITGVSNCGATTFIQAHQGSHSVAVDSGTNLVFVPIGGTAVGVAPNTGLYATFPGAGAPPNAGPTPFSQIPQPAPTGQAFLTKLCSSVSDVNGVSGTDANGCILVFQDVEPESVFPD